MLLLHIFCLRSFDHFASVVFAVQVKVEEVEVEMETPANLPNIPKEVSLGRIKQEGEQRSKSGLQEAPEQTSLEDVSHDETETSEAAEGCAGESRVEQSEGDGQKQNQEEGSSGHNNSAVGEMSSSDSEQDTTGEAAVIELS